MLRIGLLINPYAGIGGPMALKGSDGVDVAQVVQQGGNCLAAERAGIALEELKKLQGANQELMCWHAAPGLMGADVLSHYGFNSKVVGQLEQDISTAADTERLAVELIDSGIDILLFVGGDGTARNIVNSLKHSDNTRQLVLGIPAGVKMHSGVYTVSPQAAVRLLEALMRQEPVSTGLQEVRDIDEQALREGKLNSRYYGELLVPNDDRYIQQVKNTGRQSEEEVQSEIAASIVDNMEADTLYIIGCGTTPKAVMDELGLPNTLLGVDLVMGRELLAADLTAPELLEWLGKYPHHQVVILVTAIGGQGHILGRGNQQISAPVLERAGKDNTVVLITPSKLAELDKRPLFIDSGNIAIDQQWAGWVTVHTGYQQTAVYPLSCGGIDDEEIPRQG